MIIVQIIYTTGPVFRKFGNIEEAAQYCMLEGDHCIDWKVIKNLSDVIRDDDDDKGFLFSSE